MRQENDLAKGGDLTIYKWKKNYDLSTKRNFVYRKI